VPFILGVRRYLFAPVSANVSISPHPPQVPPGPDRPLPDSCLVVDLDNNEVRPPPGFVLPEVWRRKELYAEAPLGRLLMFFASFEELRSLYPSIRGTNTTLNLYVALLPLASVLFLLLISWQVL
jgi:hypothetical protein